MDQGDYIFYIVIFGAWFLPFLVKKLSANKPTTEKKGIVLRVLEFLAEMKDSGTEEVNNPQFVSPQPPIATRKTAVNAKRSQSVVLNSKSSNIAPQRYHQQKKTEPKVPSEKCVTGQPPATENKFTNKRLQFSKKQMKSAIIWSEILQPPVSLREQKKSIR